MYFKCSTQHLCLSFLIRAFNPLSLSPVVQTTQTLLCKFNSSCYSRTICTSSENKNFRIQHSPVFLLTGCGLLLRKLKPPYCLAVDLLSEVEHANWLDCGPSSEVEHVRQWFYACIRQREDLRQASCVLVDIGDLYLGGENSNQVPQGFNQGSCSFEGQPVTVAQRLVATTPLE
jgi:hypothetical protein